MRNDDPRTAVLRRVPFLHACRDDDLADLAQQIEESSVSAGTVLMREGDYGLEAFIVVDGWAAVSSGGVTVGAIGPAEFIGELAMLSGDPRSATVVARTDMTVLVLRTATFQAMAQHPDLSRALSRNLARRLADMQTQL